MRLSASLRYASLSATQLRTHRLKLLIFLSLSQWHCRATRRRHRGVPRALVVRTAPQQPRALARWPARARPARFANNLGTRASCACEPRLASLPRAGRARASDSARADGRRGEAAVSAAKARHGIGAGVAAAWPAASQRRAAAVGAVALRAARRPAKPRPARHERRALALARRGAAAAAGLVPRNRWRRDDRIRARVGPRHGTRAERRRALPRRPAPRRDFIARGDDTRRR